MNDPQPIPSDQRLDRFAAELRALGLRSPVSKRERVMLRLGAACLMLGPVLGVVAFMLSHSTTSALQQRDAIVVALGGTTVAVAGGMLFLRYSLGRFLRFWLARLVFDQDAHTVRMIELATEHQLVGAAASSNRLDEPDRSEPAHAAAR